MDYRDFRSQFEKETGNNHITEVMGRYNPVYVEWLEQLLQAGPHETIVSRRKAKRIRKDAINTLELTKGITGERDNTLKTMEEVKEVRKQL